MLALASVAPQVARADVEPEPLGLPVPRRARRQDVVVNIPGERTKTNKIALASIAGAGLVAGVIGLYFHLDWKSTSGDVEASMPTGQAWTPAHDELVARAERSGSRAGLAYGLGGAFLLGAIVTYIATDPKGTQQIIPTRSATLTPTVGGAMFGTAWRF